MIKKMDKPYIYNKNKIEHSSYTEKIGKIIQTNELGFSLRFLLNQTSPRSSMFNNRFFFWDNNFFYRG